MTDIYRRVGIDCRYCAIGDTPDRVAHDCDLVEYRYDPIEAESLWRLVVDYGNHRHTYPKRDLAHAIKGVADHYRDMERRVYKGEAWIETCRLTRWTKVSGNDV